MYSSELFSPEVLGGNLKWTWKSQGKLREFSHSKMWPPCLPFWRFWEALFIQLWHENVILARNTHNCDGTVFIQGTLLVAQSGLNRLYSGLHSVNIEAVGASH